MCNFQFDTTMVQLNVYNQYVLNLANMAHFVANELAWIILGRILIWDGTGVSVMTLEPMHKKCLTAIFKEIQMLKLNSCLPCKK